MISKLKYVGTKTEDLLDIYRLYVRSVLEYCAVVFHNGLTQEQSHQLESVQRVALATILGDNYVSYDAAREMTGIPLLSERRQQRVETFCKRAIKHPRHKQLFPPNTVDSEINVRDGEAFTVIYARIDFYQSSSVIHCQKVLNKLVREDKIKLK